MSFAFAAVVPFGLDISVRAIAAAVAVAVVLRALRVRVAAVRHAAWTAVLFAMLFMPVLAAIVPALPLSLPVPESAAVLLQTAVRDTQESALVAALPKTDARVQSSVVTRTDVTLSQHRAALNRGREYTWMSIGVAVLYAGGVLLLGARLAYGWWVATGIVRRARCNGRLDVSGGARVYESDDVAVPMTIGAVRPSVVLPRSWRGWPVEARAAILAHETAHVSRRDGLIQAVAEVNRAIFWFNPLAWWLRRTLAVTAEHACDEAGVRVTAPDRYARVLLEMAEVVRRSRGRLVRHAIGVDGGGHLQSRVDRLLRGEASAAISRTKKRATALACLLAVAVAIACRPQASAPLKEDPGLATRLADQEARTKRFEAARDMRQEEADTLEHRLVSDPEDFEARRQLVTYYSQSRRVPWDKKVPGLRRHALWLIEHHPEHEVAPPALSPRSDPEGFAAARKLWESHLVRRDATPFLIYRAASFFAPSDRRFAEQLILRGLAMDPDGSLLQRRMPAPTAAGLWQIQLASLYADALRESQRALASEGGAGDPQFSAEVRRKLEDTRDAALLGRVGGFLVRTRPGNAEQARDPTFEEAADRIRRLGVAYLERAVALDPKLTSAKSTLVRMRLGDRATEADRLANRASEQYMIAEDITEYAKKDLVTGKQQRDEAAGRAEEVLRLAAGHVDDPAYSAAVMTAHHVLALDALRNGDREGAVRHMTESVKVPTSEQVQYAPPFSWIRPVNRLLKQGERERVAEFLEAYARLTIVERERLLKDAQAVREGRMPSSYQMMVTKEGR